MVKSGEKGETAMVTDCRINQITNCDLVSFLKDTGCNGMQFQLLRFWGRHPRAKLSLYTIANALDTARFNLRHEIMALVEKGLLIAQHNGNGLTTYALTSDQRTQGYIDELARLDRTETKFLERQLEGEAVLV